MLISRRGYNWKNVLSPNWWAYNRVGLSAGGPITGILRYAKMFQSSELMFDKRHTSVTLLLVFKLLQDKLPDFFMEFSTWKLLLEDLLTNLDDQFLYSDNVNSC